MNVNVFKEVFNNDDFLVVNKPNGMGMHAELTPDGSGNRTPGFVAQIKAAYGYSELYPVHRLDKVTSGLLVLAKNTQTNSQISQLFQNREVEKVYIALGAKKPNKKQGAIIGDMSNARGGNWKLNKTKINPAITQFFSYSAGEGKRLYVIKPYTGKTHQIRVALKSLGSPIIGDERYGGQQADRAYLHAYAITFTLNHIEYEFNAWPQSGEHFSDELHAFITDLGNPFGLAWPNVPTVKPKDMNNKS